MRNEEIAGNRDTDLLKIIAGVCMLIDHMGVRLFPKIAEMRIIGRMALPLYIWCMVVGACYTRNHARYALRLLIVGIIAQPCYMLGLNHEWTKISIFGTLLMGYLGIWGLRAKKYGSQYWAPLLVLGVAVVVDMDYGWRGVLLILLMYLARQSRGGIAAVMISFCMYWGATTSMITQLFGMQLPNWLLKISFLTPFLRSQSLAILSLPLILWRRERGARPLPRWTGYAVYPGHLILLWLAQLALGLTTLHKSLHTLIPWM